MRDEIARNAQVFRVRPCHDKNYCNLVFASRSSCNILRSMLKLVIELGVTKAEVQHRFGVAPPSHNERKISKNLSRMEGNDDEE